MERKKGREDVEQLKQLLDIVRKALDCTVWRAHIGRGCGSSKDRLHTE